MNGIQLHLSFQYYSEGEILTAKLDTLEPKQLNYSFAIHELPPDLTLPPNKRCTKDYLGKELLNFTVYFSNPISEGGLSMDDIMLRSLVLYVNQKPVLCEIIVMNELPSAGAYADFVNGIGGRIYMVQYRCKCNGLLL